FYRDHIKKILYLRKGSRYVAKANYNVTRIAYLLRLFPDARFIIPVRHPVAHVESLIRQHQRFTAAATGNPRIVSQMRAGGHFEFGPHRAPIHTGDEIRLRQVLDAWHNGDDATGYALQWSMVYDYVHALSQDPSLAQSIRIVPFETSCEHPHETLSMVFRHCRLHINDQTLTEKAAKIRSPKYHPGLSDEQLTKIEMICGQTASYYGY
ncbi:MAG: sulfotransferase, partial [Alphaproteobacteria bacterium]